jgi:hypothetical protein
VAEAQAAVRDAKAAVAILRKYPKVYKELRECGHDPDDFEIGLLLAIEVEFEEQTELISELYAAGWVATQAERRDFETCGGAITFHD